MKEYGTIYITTNLINNKQYVGQTIGKIKKRITSHKNDKRNLPFANAIQKHGFENFKWISFSCPEEYLDWAETFLIAELKTQVPNGYNLETGGNKNKHLSEETKQIIRNAHLGKPLSEETRRKMSASRTGKNNPVFGNPRSEKTKQKISKKAIERYQNKEKHPMFGKHHSEISLEKMRKSKIGKNNPMWGKNKKDKEKQ